MDELEQPTCHDTDSKSSRATAYALIDIAESLRRMRPPTVDELMSPYLATMQTATRAPDG